MLNNASLSATAQKPGNGDKPLGDTVMFFVAVAALAACVASLRKLAVQFDFFTSERLKVI